MVPITVEAPFLGFTSYFYFKEPFNRYIENTYNFRSNRYKLKVVSIISIRDMIKNDHRDAFTHIYDPAGVDEVDYTQDLADNIPILSLSFYNERDLEVIFRVPLNYVEHIESLDVVEYVNKLIVIDLNRRHVDFDLSLHFNELTEFIRDRYGVTPDIKEVSIGNIELITNDEHNIRETIRKNLTLVRKTIYTRFRELELLYNSLINRTP